MRVSSHCSTRPGDFPNSTALSFTEVNLLNPSPVMVTALPIGPESGLSVAAADTGPAVASQTARVARSEIVFMDNAFSFEKFMFFTRILHYNIARLSTVKAGEAAYVEPQASGSCHRFPPFCFFVGAT